MKARSAKSKGIGFQQLICGILCARYGLKTAPLSKKSAGKTFYANESEPADLLVKGSSADGADILPISEKAKKLLCIAWECKAIRKTNDLASFIAEKDKFIQDWLYQAEKNCVGLIPVVVFKINSSKPVAIFRCNDGDIDYAKQNMRYFSVGYSTDLNGNNYTYMVLSFDAFLDCIDEIRNSARLKSENKESEINN